MGARDVARTGLAVVAGLFVACLFLQIFLAGLGVFDGAARFVTHREFGYAIGWLTLVMLILAIVGRVPGKLIGLTGLMLLLFALQSVFVAVRTDYPVVAALHPLNGVVLLLVAIAVTRWAWAERSRAQDSTAAVVPATERGTAR